MAIENNAPTKSYIYIKNLSIKYDEQLFPINNIYTKDKYIYWKIKDTNLLTSSNMLNEENLIFNKDFLSCFSFTVNNRTAAFCCCNRNIRKLRDTYTGCIDCLHQQIQPSFSLSKCLL